MSFEDKYNKYKKKYLELKSFLQLGGTVKEGDTIYSIRKLGIIDNERKDTFHYKSGNKKQAEVSKKKEGTEWIKEDLTMPAKIGDTIISIVKLGTVISVNGDEVKYKTLNKIIETTQTYKENRVWVVIPKVSSELVVSTQHVESSTTESSLKLPIDNINP